MPAGDASWRQAVFRRHYRTARVAFPLIALDEEAFVAHLAARTKDADLESIERLPVRDLFLACASERRIPAALAAFEVEILAKLDAAIVRAGGESHREDVKQAVREKLLIGSGDEGPRIADYAGEGALLTWARVIAARMAATFRRGSERRGARDAAALAAAPGALDDPELVHMRRRYADDFKAAFESAVIGLSPKDRELLRRHLIDGSTIDDLAPIYGVNRVTASRWLSRARAEVARATRRALTARLRVDAGELESVLRLVRTDLDLSLERVLRGA